MNARLLWIALATLFAMSVTAVLVAHPSVSVAIAPDGTVFYSDLQQVWAVGADGRREVAVQRVHAHELAIDPTGALIGEDSEWLGGDHYRHRVWRRSPDGRLTNALPWTSGFTREFGLTRDASGATYWVKCRQARFCTVVRRDRAGATRDVVRHGQFTTRINWIAASPAGEVYVVDGAFLRKVNREGRLENVAKVSRREGHHQLMGLTLDRDGNVYVANHAERAVFRVSPSGNVQTVVRSAAPWAPTGVALSPRGEMWILEWAGTRTRVRKVALPR